ncbi:type I-F CRISPR-associated endoribonuclease Cas6/Csy4 [Shewanella sp. C32]|uniref:Type I-F CRISPR-associated endoribonuclease Cas6/Csy4 n=1 Tax=Shewanella electrica TaxID=515560 RepID=A0ABT2FJA3_9GAMM|nr:type I-F CRISPR-associated endoribonuclease Cas6/Csy4 [Shewanella electrica]MCH1924164.1 type I-F CRISPR-associated endoribonuclease Cas6/Csy4 [Shewanella electrica]MCS4556067.1 type I-F CRISPR-associated endoribonuclease Cas6/Csy4 [Shewanella electrica]
MTQYCFIVKYLPKEANVNVLAGKCLSILHGFVARHNVQGLGVTFPDWSDSSIGSTIAFVHADSALLAQFSQQRYFTDMRDFGFFSVGEINRVPEQCAQVRFLRNQHYSKQFVGSVRRRIMRLKRRAAQRGEEYIPSGYRSETEYALSHSIPTKSRSTQQGFMLHIQKELAEKNEVVHVFNGYGLSDSTRAIGTVPDLHGLF